MKDLDTIEKLVERELIIDQAEDDVTTHALFGGAAGRCVAFVVARERGIFCGQDVCRAFQNLQKANIQIENLISDGSNFEQDQHIVKIQGDGVSCLAIERTLLNFLSHSCGVATLTRKFVDVAKEYGVKILGTRKTLPGLRRLELAAVSAGGGFVHRRSLSDGILIKDNHLRFLEETEALERAEGRCSPLHRVEIEIQQLELLDRVLENPPDVILLDNMSVEKLKIAVQKIGGRCKVEVSGGVNLDELDSIAKLGVQYISVGRLTHSAPSINLSLDIIEICQE